MVLTYVMFYKILQTPISLDQECMIGLLVDP